VSAEKGKGYGRGARILSIGLASTGLVTFGYFSIASHALNDEAAYGRIGALWSAMFIVASIIYRPIEQLLAREIAAGRARGSDAHPLRDAVRIQAIFAGAFLVLALAFKGRLVELFDGDETLFWILVAGVLFYAASYFARGWLAGHQWFTHYGALVFMEATTRVLFAIAVAVGIAEGQDAVALGMAAAPLVSLVVVPLALRKRLKRGPADPVARGEARGAPVPRGDRGGRSSPTHARFAIAVLVIFAAEQALLNAAVLTVEDSAVRGYVFSVLLIARAPLQLFQAVQGALLPHLAGLDATAGAEEFKRAIRVTVLAIAAFAGAVALGLLAIGPFAMDLLFEDEATFGRWGLALVAVGMGAHLVAGTLNQAALARDHAAAAAVSWVLAALGFVAWMLVDVVPDALLRAEIGYCGAALALCAGLRGVYARA
jgi:O-antigen/teichoic acid export membrane protein